MQISLARLITLFDTDLCRRLVQLTLQQLRSHLPPNRALKI
jgi:hypothetical protein